MSKTYMSRKYDKMVGFTRAEVLLALLLLALVLTAVLIGTHSFVGGGPGPSDACRSNLRIIEGAKMQWALVNHKQNTDTPTGRDIQPYMGRGSAGELPVCPDDPKHTFESSYSINNLLTKPTCKIMPTNHILP